MGSGSSKSSETTKRNKVHSNEPQTVQKYEKTLNSLEPSAQIATKIRKQQKIDIHVDCNTISLTNSYRSIRCHKIKDLYSKMKADIPLQSEATKKSNTDTCLENKKLDIAYQEEPSKKLPIKSDFQRYSEQVELPQKLVKSAFKINQNNQTLPSATLIYPKTFFDPKNYLVKKECSQNFR